MLFNKDNWNKLSKHKNGFIIVCGSPVYLLENDFVFHVRTCGKLATRLIKESCGSAIKICSLPIMYIALTANNWSGSAGNRH